MTFFDLTRSPEIAVRLRPEYRISTTANGSGFQLEAPGQSVSLGSGLAGFDAVLPSLLSGAPLADLRDQVVAHANREAGAGLLIWLQRLARMGLFEYPLIHSGRTILTILPQQLDFVPQLPGPDAAPSTSKALSRFAVLRRAGDGWLVEHPLISCRLAIDDSEVLSTLMHWASGREPDPARADTSAGLIARALSGLGFLDDDPRRSTQHDTVDILKQWNSHDLAFHLHSRRGFHFDPAGGLFPFIDEIEPLPALRPSWEGQPIPLDRAPETNTSHSLSQVVAERKSSRFYVEDSPVTLSQLGIFLDRVASASAAWKIPVSNYRGSQTEMEVSRRPYPNGGASYELEIYPVISVCDGLDRGIYHYDAGKHALVAIDGYSDKVHQMMKDANMATAGMANPQILFAIAARFSRVMWKYQSIAYAVILRNAGVLYQTMYLTATDMGLSPCGVGSGDSALFAEVTGLDPIAEGTVGEFILGGPPADPPAV